MRWSGCRESGGDVDVVEIITPGVCGERVGVVVVVCRGVLLKEKVVALGIGRAVVSQMRAQSTPTPTSLHRGATLICLR